MPNSKTSWIPAQTLIWISLFMAFGLGSLVSSFTGGTVWSSVELDRVDESTEGSEFAVPDEVLPADSLPPPMTPP